MGGLNGGRSKDFLKLATEIKKKLDIDTKNNIVPRWHDESLLNRYMVDYMKTNNPLILLPEYAIPQENAFTAQELKPYMKMILLDKKRYGGKDWLRTIK